MSPDPIISSNAADWALFLDVDGTLLEIAETPQDVRVTESLKGLLNTLVLRLNGALALISGRSLDDLDQLFAPLRFCAAGIHGCERREASGCIVRPPFDLHRLDDARTELSDLVQQHPGMILEDKGYGLALHFRRVPHLSAEAERRVNAICQRLGREFAIQAGKCVLEIRLADWTKGASIRAFMEQPPFRSRRPIYLGDDLTDEAGFGVVNELGGISIRVGDAHLTLAQHRLAGVSDVLRWLESIPR